MSNTFDKIFNKICSNPTKPNQYITYVKCLSYTQHKQKLAAFPVLSIGQFNQVTSSNHNKCFTSSDFFRIPKLGNPRVRENKFQKTGSESMVYVTWTTTRKNVVAEQMVPNHLVPLLPIDVNSNHPIEDCIVTKTLRNSGMHVEETYAEEWVCKVD